MTVSSRIKKVTKPGQRKRTSPLFNELELRYDGRYSPILLLSKLASLLIISMGKRCSVENEFNQNGLHHEAI